MQGKAFGGDGNGGLIVKYPLLTIIITLMIASVPYLVNAVTVTNQVTQIGKDIERIDIAREKVWTSHAITDENMKQQLAECKTQTELLKQSIDRMQRDVSEIKADVKQIKMWG